MLPSSSAWTPSPAGHPASRRPSWHVPAVRGRRQEQPQKQGSVIAMKHIARSLFLSSALCALALGPVHAEMDVPALKAAIEKSFEADYPKLDALYKDLHAYPELAFQEVKTA